MTKDEVKKSACGCYCVLRTKPHVVLASLMMVTLATHIMLIAYHFNRRHMSHPAPNPAPLRSHPHGHLNQAEKSFPADNFPKLNDDAKSDKQRSAGNLHLPREHPVEIHIQVPKRVEYLNRGSPGAQISKTPSFQPIIKSGQNKTTSILSKQHPLKAAADRLSQAAVAMVTATPPTVIKKSNTSTVQAQPQPPQNDNKLAQVKSKPDAKNKKVKSDQNAMPSASHTGRKTLVAPSKIQKKAKVANTDIAGAKKASPKIPARENVQNQTALNTNKGIVKPVKIVKTVAKEVQISKQKKTDAQKAKLTAIRPKPSLTPQAVKTQNQPKPVQNVVGNKQQSKDLSSQKTKPVLTPPPSTAKPTTKSPLPPATQKVEAPQPLMAQPTTVKDNSTTVLVSEINVDNKDAEQWDPDDDMMADHFFQPGKH